MDNRLNSSDSILEKARTQLLNQFSKTPLSKVVDFCPENSPNTAEKNKDCVELSVSLADNIGAYYQPASKSASGKAKIEIDIQPSFFSSQSVNPSISEDISEDNRLFLREIDYKKLPVFALGHEVTHHLTYPYNPASNACTRGRKYRSKSQQVLCSLEEISADTIGLLNAGLLDLKKLKLSYNRNKDRFDNPPQTRIRPAK